jgi:hypothetical protein
MGDASIRGNDTVLVGAFGERPLAYRSAAQWRGNQLSRQPASGLLSHHEHSTGMVRWQGNQAKSRG